MSQTIFIQNLRNKYPFMSGHNYFQTFCSLGYWIWPGEEKYKKVQTGSMTAVLSTPTNHLLYCMLTSILTPHGYSQIKDDL